MGMIRRGYGVGKARRAGWGRPKGMKKDECRMQNAEGRIGGFIRQAGEWEWDNARTWGPLQNSRGLQNARCPGNLRASRNDFPSHSARQSRHQNPLISPD